MIVTTQGNPNTNKIKYRAVFSGEVLTTLSAINPNREEYIELHELQNIAEKISEPKYDNINLPTGVYTKIEFHLSFNPNKVLGLSEPMYKDRVVVPYSIFINDEYVYNHDKSKIQIIDSHIQSAWIPYDGKSAKSSLQAVHKNLNGKNKEDLNYYERRLLDVDVETVRHAKNGEVLIYEFLWSTTWYRPHFVSEDPKKNFSLTFLLSDPNDPDADPSEVFSRVVNGDYGILRQIFDQDGMYVPTTQGAKRKVQIGVFLGVRRYMNVSHQEVLSNPRALCVFRESTVPYQANGADGKIYNTRLPNEALRIITNPDRPWKFSWTGKTEFMEYVPGVHDAVPSTVEEDDSDSGDFWS